jgi:hypothetical protein
LNLVADTADFRVGTEPVSKKLNGALNQQRYQNNVEITGMV